MKDKVLNINNLKIHFFTRKGIVRAVDSISFNVRKGETLGIVGESGCGKTTAVLGIMKMIPPPGKILDGQIILEDTNIISLSEKTMRKKIRWEIISMVFQGAMNCLTPVYTVGKQMMETIQEHRKIEPVEARKRILKYLNLVGLSEEIFKRYPHELSGGMKQRVVIATSLFLEPKIVICDEPTTALDVVIQAQIIKDKSCSTHGRNIETTPAWGEPRKNEPVGSRNYRSRKQPCTKI